MVGTWKICEGFRDVVEEGEEEEGESCGIVELER